MFIDRSIVVNCFIFLYVTVSLNIVCIVNPCQCDYMVFLEKSGKFSKCLFAPVEYSWDLVEKTSLATAYGMTYRPYNAVDVHITHESLVSSVPNSLHL
jgi:hypothetical protein